MNNINKLPFSLPPEISCARKLLDNNTYAFVFRHDLLGEIGRLVILPQSKGSEFIYEVVGAPDDPMTIKRREIFEPIARKIIKIFNEMFGKDAANVRSSVVPKETAIIKAEIMPCKICAAPVAAMIIAPDAYSVDCLEDYARIAFSKIKELNVPTWIVGAEKEVSINGDVAGEALVLKVWPERKPAKTISSIELNDIFAKLMEDHCIH